MVHHTRIYSVALIGLLFSQALLADVAQDITDLLSILNNEIAATETIGTKNTNETKIDDAETKRGEALAQDPAPDAGQATALASYGTIISAVDAAFILDKARFTAVQARPAFGQDDQAAIDAHDAIVSASASALTSLTSALDAIDGEADVKANLSNLIATLTEIKQLTNAQNKAATVDKLSTEIRKLKKDLLIASEDEKDAIIASISEKIDAYIEARTAHRNITGTLVEDIDDMIANPTDYVTEVDINAEGVVGANAAERMFNEQLALHEENLRSKMNLIGESFDQYRGMLQTDIQNYVIATLKPQGNMIALGNAIVQWAGEALTSLLASGDFANDEDFYANEWATVFVAKYNEYKNATGLTLSAEERTALEALPAGELQGVLDMVDTTTTYLNNVDLAAGEVSSVSGTDYGPIFRIAEQADTAQQMSDALTLGAYIFIKGSALFDAKIKYLLNNISENISLGTVHSTTTNPDNNGEVQPLPAGITTIDHDGSNTFSEQIVTRNPGVPAEQVFLVTGDNETFGRLREIALSEGADKLTADIKIYMNKSARVGLGTSSLSDNPGNTLNVLGGGNGAEDKSVTIIADGNCYIDVNSDLQINGTNPPLIATENFGANSTHRVTFYSPVEREIRVTAGTTWDLRHFGQAGRSNGQQIAFAGKVKLILEPGAVIRLPYLEYEKRTHGPILYFNDESEFVIEGDGNRDAERWEDGDGTEAVRSKIIGTGQVWLNKKAEMFIGEFAHFGVEADATTPKTAVTFSLQRDAKLLIGSSNDSGGCFQVGNKVNVASSSIDFELVTNGPLARCEIHREGFLGFGAGIINKSGNPNGTAPDEDNPSAATAWQVQSLHNVNNVKIDISQGGLRHRNIADGTSSSSSGSVLAIGPLMPTGNYVLNVQEYVSGTLNRSGVIQGGGNVLFIDSGIDHDDPYTVNIWDTEGVIDFTENDRGKYSLLASDIIMRKRHTEIEGEGARAFGRGIVYVDSESYFFSGPQEEFYTAITVADHATTREDYVTVGQDDNEGYLVGYTTNGVIKRITPPTVTNSIGATSSASEGLAYGYLIVKETDADGLPTKLGTPN